ncbi:MAG: DUF3786 domain-containing protein [Desulfobacterales bacterium]
MPTAACGINCEVCRLFTLGFCSSCGSGTSDTGRKKAAVQETLLGQPCPILACAIANHLEYCMRDCGLFPCENFENGPYPFSKGFLGMQTRRLESASTQEPLKKQESMGKIQIPSEHWENLQKKDPEELCRIALTQLEPSGEIQIRFLDTDLLVNVRDKSIQKKTQEGWKPLDDPLMELLTVVYLLQITSAPLRQELVSEKDFKYAHFFQGPHELETRSLLKRFGRNISAFKMAAERVGGRPFPRSDAGYVFSPFPKVLLYYLLWEGDEEFEPRLSILFDRSIENFFAADFVWGLVRHVSGVLLSCNL